MVTDRERRFVFVLTKLRVFRVRIGLFRTIEVVPRRGFKWIIDWLLKRQTVDSLWHAPCCEANHWHKRRLVFRQCTCGAAAHAQTVNPQP